MAKINEAELKKQIKESNFSNLYLLYGDEKMLVKVYTEKLRDKIAGKAPSDFNYHVYTEVIDTNKVAMDFDIVPFAMPVNYIEITDPNLDSATDKEFDAFVAALENLPAATTVVISMLTVNNSGKKLSRWRKITELAAKQGTVAVLDKKTVSELKKQLISWAAKRGKTLSAPNAQLMVEYCGNDLQALQNETEKLCAYTGDLEITAKDINKIVTKNLEARVFDMADAVVKGNYETAYQKLNLLFYQREEPINILAVLSGSYVDMYRVRIAIESGETPNDLTDVFDYKRKEFKLNKAQKLARGISTDALAESLEILADTNTKMNSSSAEKQILLEQLVSKLIMAGKRA